MTRLELVHALPGRQRLRFQPPIPPHQALELKERISGSWPELPFRLWGLGQGIVVGNGIEALAPDLIPRLAALLAQPLVHTPTWRDSLQDGLMVLAILGWALPLLPGTPFFLLALALRARRR